MKKRVPKAEYFHKRYKEALRNGLADKAAYFERRLKEMGEYNAMTNNVVEQTRANISKMSRDERINRAAKILSETKSGFSQQEKQAYLLHAGLTQDEYLEALNVASGGELIQSALGD